MYLALLRGINVGGNNIIKMDDLRHAFESMGFFEVKTYIQSGNVIFGSSETNQAKLTEIIEAKLSEMFLCSMSVVILTEEELKLIINQAPKGFGEMKEQYRYDVWFLKPQLISEEVRKQVRLREGVDQITTGKNVIYASRLINEASKSLLIKINQSSLYQNMTVRNWNTTKKLSELIKK
jgi:uncharacterized protein (DUF1697 family)